MQELEKILEEIGIRIAGSIGKKREGLLEAENIIRKHMNDDWISVEERLPEVNGKIEDDAECPEYNVTIRGAEESTTLRYSPADETWFDDLGYVYPVVAWQPLPEPYRPEQPETCKYTGSSCCWPIDQCRDCPKNPGKEI